MVFVSKMIYVIRYLQRTNRQGAYLYLWISHYKKTIEGSMMSEIKAETLTKVLSKMLGTKVINANFQTTSLHGGTVGKYSL